LPVLGEERSYFTIKYYVSFSIFTDALYQGTEVAYSSWFVATFIMNECWITSNAFSVSTIMWVFVLNLLLIRFITGQQTMTCELAILFY